MPDQIHDVVVAGAGPAGSRIARQLAGKGFSVVVLEEHPAIGRPCHCSGLVSPRTLELADVGEDIIRNTIHGAVVHVAGRDPVAVAGDRVHAHVVDRIELDRRLALQAERYGATFLRHSRLIGFRTTGDTRGATSGEVVADVVRDGTPTHIRARLLVGADGAHSRVARQLRRGAPAANAVVGLGAEAGYDRNPRLDHVELFLDADAAPGWFGWTIPLDRETARLGTGSANGIKPRESFRRLRQVFPDSFGAARVRRFSGGLIAVWRPSTLVEDRVVLVGDAARQVKPTSGGGIHAALQAAAMAASSVERAFDRGSLSRASLSDYARAWERSVGRELRRQADMRRVLNRLTNRDHAALLAMLDHSPTLEALASAADIDYPSRLIARLGVQQPKLLLKLLTWPRHPGAWIGGG